MLLPALLIAAAVLLAAVGAYGTEPLWAQYTHGLTLLTLAFRLRWLLAAVSIGLCLTVIGLVVAGRRRAWWLLGLSPVLALFVHQFATSPMSWWKVADNPPCVAASEAGYLDGADWVVGVRFADQWWAYPLSGLYQTPLIVRDVHEKRMLLMWSPFANRAIAVPLGRQVRSRDLQIVSMPANALLCYNVRLGEFINGLTGLTLDGKIPTGFHAPLPVRVCDWNQWRMAHPDTLVMAGPRRFPTGPLLPYYPLPPANWGHNPQTRIAFFPATQPAALPLADIPAVPLNIHAAGRPLLVWRDGNGVHLFDRRLPEQLTPRFRAVAAAARRDGKVFMLDSDTPSTWSAAGIALDGPLKGQKLVPVPCEENLYWGVMKFWYPNLQMAEPAR